MKKSKGLISRKLQDSKNFHKRFSVHIVMMLMFSMSFVNRFNNSEYLWAIVIFAMSLLYVLLLLGDLYLKNLEAQKRESLQNINIDIQEKVNTLVFKGNSKVISLFFVTLFSIYILVSTFVSTNWGIVFLFAPMIVVIARQIYLRWQYLTTSVVIDTSRLEVDDYNIENQYHQDIVSGNIRGDAQ